MPLYDYDCSACGRRFEAIHGVHAEPPTVCPLCGSGPVRKAIAAPAVHFKGSGWAKKERRTAARSTETTTKEGVETSTGAAGSSGDTAAAAATSKGPDADTSASTTEGSTTSSPTSTSAGSD